ncbi:hypothetical protein A4D02_07550 [Niastella koreensis]|uniref:Uncharacterized protein n=2 Tax=Niastella koreensis TaxID=354356 RepID=G8TJV2_NIAKG|nr:hypothetical protein [Niastella koreensis]AEW01850.1 hypothetical protein Niako_5618 [Niastella koreensis GR20-10]OQP48556.1 hypothetical protein A4D02_07550 [Niastella koreensis]
MKENGPAEMALFEQCIDFLNNVVGIETSFRKIGNKSFLPGLLINKGTIIIDKDALEHPGDILHEAGHIAIVPAFERLGLSEKDIVKRRNREGEEIMAIAWSYAACIYLSIDPFFVFHEEGYRGGRDFITDGCRDKNYIGLDMLENIGMTFNDKKARKSNQLPYPHMVKWLRA